MISYEDWKSRALEADILAEAIARGAKLRRTGREHIGPCPACGGTDRFSINPQKRIFNCRGAEGGDVIGLVMHIDGISFTQACEQLTGEPPPNGQSKPLSPAELAERDKRRQANEAAQRAREAQEEAREQNTLEAAQRIWDASKPIDGTLAQTYLFNRGIPVFESECLRFHPALPYPGKPKPYPALVCRVDDMGGDLCAVWRIFLREDGRKADVPAAKLGLGPAGGGAVRLGGIGPKVAIAEGLESALGFWFLTGRKYPVLAALSTSGMVGIELPLCVERVVIAPDGDRPIKKQGDEYIPAVPAGRKAAHTLRDRLISEGLSVTLAAEPPAGQDYLNIWQAMAGENA
jgi:putative DNA primase/helicase